MFHCEGNRNIDMLHVATYMRKWPVKNTYIKVRYFRVQQQYVADILNISFHLTCVGVFLNLQKLSIEEIVRKCGCVYV
jgi:hypothetical protein